MKEAIIIVYHGSHNEKINDMTSTLLTKMVREKYSNFEVYEVFTSKIVLERLVSKRYSVKGCLEDIKSKNIKRVYVLTTNLIHGTEFVRLINLLDESGLDYKTTLSLIEDTETLSEIAKILVKDEDATHLFVGHGSSTKSNEGYLLLEQKFRELNKNNHFICVVDGKPTYKDIETSLSKNKKLILYPLMYVSGYHAQKDVKGLMEKIKNEYISVEYIDISLGMNKKIQNIYLKKLDRIIKN